MALGILQRVTPLLTPQSLSIIYKAQVRDPFPRLFSSCSKKQLREFLEKGGGICLFNLPDLRKLYGGQRCGNGYVEEAEECDCGEVQ
eukprot:g18709.t1